MMRPDGSQTVPSPIAVDCPTCFAKPLEHCTTMGGRSCKPHARRTAAAKDCPGTFGTITTGKGPEVAPAPSWGIAPPPDVRARAAWGARAIYKGPGSVALLWDRQGGAGHNASLLALLGWLDEIGLPRLRAECRLGGYSDKTFTISDGCYTLTASPKASHGYLYIGAWAEAVS